MASVRTVRCTTDVTSGGHETHCHNLQREVRTTSPVNIDCIGLAVHIGYSESVISKLESLSLPESEVLTLK